MKISSNDYFIFNGGEVHCKLSTTADISRIVCLDYTMNGFMAVCEYIEIIRRKGLTTKLVYPYFPYARQDRIMNENEPFSLRIFCNLLNSQKFESVTIYDPHSDVAPALLNNCKVVPQWEIAKAIIPKEYLSNPDVIFISPDAGAYKKLSKLVPNDYRIAIGTKIRGSDGNIIKTTLYSPVDLKDKTCVMVDDICDGGKTFIELAKVLKHKGASKIILYITHGIFSNGPLVLKGAGIDHVYTTNSIQQADPKWFEAEGIKEFLTIANIV